MLVVVEGVDRTGKSSLCRELAEASSADRITTMHFSAPEKSALDEYVTPLLGYDPWTDDVIVDRHYLGELVWPQIFGRPSRMSETERHCIELFLLSRNAVCVWAWRDDDDLERACANEPCVGRAAESQRLFGAAVSESILDWVHYVHGDSIDKIMQLGDA